MKIYKYLHSCIVFEDQDFKLLVDPGMFSFAEGQVTTEMFSDVQAIIITHNHPDHLDTENLKKIVSLTKAPVYTNAQVAQQLDEEGIQAELLTDGDFTIGPFKVQAFSVVHEPLLDAPVPQMTALIINGKVLHPVDSFEEKMFRHEGIELLLLPIMAPFTNELKVAEFADRLKPKQILAVHDGYVKDFFLNSRHNNYQKHFEKNDIKYIVLKNSGDSIEIN